MAPALKKRTRKVKKHTVLAKGREVPSQKAAKTVKAPAGQGTTFKLWLNEEEIEIELAREFILKHVAGDESAAKDGVTGEKILLNLDYYAERMSAVLIKDKKHKFKPYLELLQTKGRNKVPRVISKASMIDKLVLARLKEKLHEKLKLEIPFALPGEVIRNLSRDYHLKREKKLYFAKLDIKAFYDAIPHKSLLAKLEKAEIGPNTFENVRRAIKNHTLAWRESASSVMPERKKGVPQGLPISNILASFYLNSADRLGKKVFDTYYRYVDDILVFSTKKVAIQAFIKKIESLGLSINEKFQQGGVIEAFDYLGYSFDAGVVAPKQTAQERFLSQVFKVIKETESRLRKVKASSSEDARDAIKSSALYRINLKITGAIYGNKKYGWLAYYCQGNRVSCLFRMNAIIRLRLTKKFGADFMKTHALRSLVDSFYDMKHYHGSRLALNFNKLELNSDKMAFLVRMGVISMEQSSSIPEHELHVLFNKIVKKELHSLQADTGYVG